MQISSFTETQSKRNCACFTPEGVVYTKMKVARNFAEGHRLRKRTQNALKTIRRHKREVTEIDFPEVYHTELPYEMEELLDLHNTITMLHEHLPRREKRELTSNLFDNSPNYDGSKKNSTANDAISKVIQEIQNTLETLELKFIEHDLNNVNNATKLSASGFVRGGKFPKVGGRVGTSCYIEAQTGKVNCSDVIYDDEKMWRKSRNQIDMLIKVLKEKITHLKDIKKQLRENKQQQQQQNGRSWNTEFINNKGNSATVESIDDLATIAEEYLNHRQKNRRRMGGNGNSNGNGNGNDNVNNVHRGSHHQQQFNYNNKFNQQRQHPYGTQTGRRRYNEERDFNNYFEQEQFNIFNQTERNEAQVENDKINTGKNVGQQYHPQKGRRLQQTLNVPTFGGKTPFSTTETSTAATRRTSSEMFLNTSTKSTTKNENSNEKLNTMKNPNLNSEKFYTTSATTKTTTENENGATVFSSTETYQPIALNGGQKEVYNQISHPDASDSFHKSKFFGAAECYCEPENESTAADSKEIAREARRKLKEERQRRKERKRIKKARLEKECLSEKMNCFSHDNTHWRTAPLWNDSPFCFCMNANNNTYSCVRTINATHNYLYCEFTTGLITYYNLKIDPFETLNRASSLTDDEKSHMHDTLVKLKGCRGKSCTLKRHHIESGSNMSNQTSRGTKRKPDGRRVTQI